MIGVTILSVLIVGALAFVSVMLAALHYEEKEREEG